MKRRMGVVSLLLAAAVGLTAGCGAVRSLSKADSDRADAVAARIAEARRMDAEKCAPRELANAEMQLDWARHEAMEFGPRSTIEQHFAQAEQAATALRAKTEPCWNSMRDSDGDGVPDYRDRCPNTPRGVKVDAVGCVLDSDGDGVPDGRDHCPDTPRGVQVDAVGCPLDSDGDGVPDYQDQCPNTPRGVQVDADGCPLDSDGDGVPDYQDRCPNTPRGVKVDTIGCPIPVAKPPPPAAKVTTVELRIFFDFNSDVVKPEYFGEVRKVAEFMQRHPDVDAVIEGHTDNIGTEIYNLKLSARRANSVAKLLNERYGIALERLTAQSLGESQPIASNATPAGRAQNRRVYAHMEAEE